MASRSSSSIAYSAAPVTAWSAGASSGGRWWPEWSGAAPQLKQAKARRYQEPPKCKDVTERWSRLPAWERLGEEVKLAGVDLPEWMRSAALEKLLPAQLLATLISCAARAFDLLGAPGLG